MGAIVSEIISLSAVGDLLHRLLKAYPFGGLQPLLPELVLLPVEVPGDEELRFSSEPGAEEQDGEAQYRDEDEEGGEEVVEGDVEVPYGVGDYPYREKVRSDEQ